MRRNSPNVLLSSVFCLLVAVWPRLGAATSDPGEDAALAPFLEKAPRCDPRATWCFSIALHIVVKEDGFPVVTPEWLAHQLREVNRYFMSIDVSFQVDTVDSLPASDEVVVTRDHRDRLGRHHYTRRVLHAFVIGHLFNVDEPGEIRGVHWRDRKARSHHWVVLAGIADDWVLAHEIGHFFGLPHSTYPISIMNKTPRDKPDPAVRGFARQERARMRRRLHHFIKTGELVPVGEPRSDQ